MKDCHYLSCKVSAIRVHEQIRSLKLLIELHDFVWLECLHLHFDRFNGRLRGFFLQVSLGGRGDFRNFVDEFVGYSNLWPKLAMRGRRGIGGNYFLCFEL